jgi:protein-tyrosine phosphatase
MTQVTWIINDVLAHAEYPHQRDLDDLHNKGIRAIVSLEKRPYSDLAIIQEKNFDYLEVPVRDFTAPTIEQLTQIHTFIDKKNEEGKPVLVHCFKAGRSGTVLAGYLIHLGKGPGLAVQEIRGRIPGAIEVKEQEEILERYAKMQKKPGGRDI